MTQVAIVYHSGYGHTRRMAQSVAEGAAKHAQVHSIEIDAEGNVPESAWQTLLDSDAIVFGSPTYMGSVSWQFKKFADATSKPWFTQQWKDKLAAGFTNSASMNRRQALDAALPDDAGDAAQHAVGGYRPDAEQQQGGDAPGHQLRGVLRGRDGGHAVRRIGG